MTRRRKRATPIQLNEEQLDLYQKIALGARATESAFPLVDESGALTGPFDAMLLLPALGDALQALGSVLRFEGCLSDRAREIAILLVAHHHGSEFEVCAHEGIGRRVGLSETDLMHIAEGRAPDSADESEEAVAALVVHLLQHVDLDDDTYRFAVQVLGESVIFEVNAIVGYYSLLATQLKIFG